MAARHYFLCGACKKHVTYVTEFDAVDQPGRTHSEALTNGGVPAARRDVGGEHCLGVLTYCSGVDVTNNMRPCGTHARGTEILHVRPVPTGNKDWVDFERRVSTAWNAFVASGYSLALRGVNNHREYRPTPAVHRVLQGGGGVVQIDGAVYVVSNSLTAGVSLHRSIPAAHRHGNAQSFIFHL